MKISIERMRQWVALPHAAREVRDLFDDLGLEVKRVHEQDGLGTLFTLELLANRGDHHGYHGLAREISGRTGGAVTPPPTASLTVGAPPVPLVNEVGDALLSYSATLLERTDAAEGLDPAELIPLVAAGLDPVSAPVDATNLANLEFGQPTHAFDADTVDGPIVVRFARAGEKAWPLFAPEPVVVPDGAIVIADRVKVLAIAGVIGCEESKTTASTRRVLLESATFDPVRVRKAARALNTHTDSSARFERGGDPEAPLVGAGRVAWLLERHGWRRVGATGQIGAWSDPNRWIYVTVGHLAGFLQYPLTPEEIADRLGRYGFVCVTGRDAPYDSRVLASRAFAESNEKPRDNALFVRVPSHRLWDVETWADLAEELARSIGYNATPSTLPAVDMGALPTDAEVARSRVDDVLVGHGFYEVFTDGFYGRDLRDKLGISESHALWHHVETQNAVDRGYSLLKNNALAQAVDAVATNLRLHTKEIRCFEWTRTFHPTFGPGGEPVGRAVGGGENGVCTERKVLWAIASGPRRSPNWSEDIPDADAQWMRGIVEELAAELGVKLAFGTADAALPVNSLLHPNRQLTIRRDGRAIGALGEVHPQVLAGFKIKRERPIYLELDPTALFVAGAAADYVAPPESQVISRDLAFTLPHRFAAAEVAAHLRDSGPAWLDDVRITDLFAHEIDGKAVRTVTYTLTFVREKTPTAEELNQVTESLIGAVRTRFEAVGVRLRA